LAIERHQADEVLMAIRNADLSLMRLVVRQTEEADVPLTLRPAPQDTLAALAPDQNVSDIPLEELLDREEITIDIESVSTAFSGRSVLVTGAGSPIAAEIAQQVAAFRPSRLVLLDLDETRLRSACGGVPGATLFVADVRDQSQLEQVFVRYRPEVVLHAAALDDVLQLEAHPTEAVRTNVLGTRNLAEVAANSGVRRLVFISSWKATKPQNILGHSKSLGEQLVLHRAPEGASWCCVRLGNTVGSEGGVTETFARQIAAGGPVTVTHPHMTRFFMSPSEAVRLVLCATAMSRHGEIFMLKTGRAVNILELAERMVRLLGRDNIEFRFTGLRSGDRVSDDVQQADAEQATEHPNIVRLAPRAIPDKLILTATEALDHLVAHLDYDMSAAMVALGKALAPGADEADIVTARSILRGIGELHGVEEIMRAGSGPPPGPRRRPERERT
jgi:FlaA1/EpsC-like NDP-sugar epimerase